MYHKSRDRVNCFVGHIGVGTYKRSSEFPTQHIKYTTNSVQSQLACGLALAP